VALYAHTYCNTVIIPSTAYSTHGTHYTERRLQIISGYRNPNKDKTMQYDILGFHRGVAEEVFWDVTLRHWVGSSQYLEGS
jgi:hypothetical protein